MTTISLNIDGFTRPGWEAVRDAFAGTFARHGEAGAAICVYHAGQPVVDLAAGVTADGRPYTRETIQPFMSVSKGIVAITANMLADQGMLDLDAPVARYWPEFARADKETILVRWLLTHQAGLAALDRRLSRAELLSWTPVIKALEAQSPNWPPGTAHGYHSMTYGFLVGEVIRRVTGELPGPWIASHVSSPLNAPCHLGLPQALHGTVAPVRPFPPQPDGQASTLRLDPDSLPFRASVGCADPPLSPLAVNDPDVQAAQFPAVNGIGSARGLARIFAALIGEVDSTRLLSGAAMEAARREQVRGPDLAAVAMPESALGLGFTLPTRDRPLGGPGSFGTVGLGGCRAWALPEAALAYAYLPTQLLDANPDPRDEPLTAATLQSLLSTGDGAGFVPSLREYGVAMACRITELVLDCRNPEVLADFWCQVLGFVVLQTEEDNSIEIGPAGTDPDNPGLTLVLSPSTQPKQTKLRLHFDVNAVDRSQDEELQRLFELGARKADVGQTGEESWHVLADPEGNEFCLLRRTVKPAS